MGSLHVDNCTDFENNGFCFSQSDGSSSERTLDVGSSNMTIGGLRTIEFISLHPAQIKTHDFVGCIRNINVNGILLRPSMALTTYNILYRCPRATVSPCHGDPCKNAGVCHDLWSDYLCECKGPFIGSNCAKETSEEVVLRFKGNDYIEYVIKERFKRDLLLKELLDDKREGNEKDQTVINIKFKTKGSGALMCVIGQTGYIVLKIKDTKPVYLSEDTLSGHVSEFTVDAPVADGVWHVLTLYGNGQTVILALDGKPVLNNTDRSVDLTPARVEKIILGAALTGDSKLQQSGFTGCVQYLNVSGYTLPASGRSVMVEVWPSWSLVQSSCISPGVCLPSPCSEGDTARRVCLSGQCQTRWRCGPAVQDRSCICLHNVSDQACDICISPGESHNQCSGTQGRVPLWLTAVILPIISILVIIGMLVVLCRLRRRNAMCQSDSLPQKREQGTENAAVCLDDNQLLTNAASAEGERQRGPVSADQQGSGVELSCDATQPEPNSELEYHEIGSISSALHSDTASVKLSWHKHLCGTKCVKADPKRCGDLKRLLAGFRKGERAKSPANSQRRASQNKQLFTRIDAEQSQRTPKRSPQPEFPEPVQCLTFEEISKLNAPLRQKRPDQVFLTSGHNSATTVDVSSDSETDSTFTFSGSDCGQLSVISPRGCGHEQSSLSTHSFRQQDILPVSTLFKHTCLYTAGQHEDESAPPSAFEQWESILNIRLPFSSYVPVFEDIAGLPMQPSHSYDMQSDIEEMI
ncbi:protocadherin Fat 4-like isoform X2 [Scophthalmus maximus]|uniref:protocadherin Fat 4-like isoform X2 n=1 Tax=Scophthalmus maximus TaxID=52904 RepID=UPI001FA84D9F|nr:protocadherin Fat 4-like isoform X2 [Scophthalmus maximus]